MVQRIDNLPPFPNSRMANWQPAGEPQEYPLSAYGTAFDGFRIFSNGVGRLRIRSSGTDVPVEVRTKNGSVHTLKGRRPCHFNLPSGSRPITVSVGDSTRYEIRRC
jgi:hypothetical protein